MELIDRHAQQLRRLGLTDNPLPQRAVDQLLEQPCGFLPVRSPWQLEDCGWVANRWSELLPLPLAMKQRLMTLDNPLLRLELVADLLGQLQIGSAG